MAYSIILIATYGFMISSLLSCIILTRFFLADAFGAFGAFGWVNGAAPFKHHGHGGLSELPRNQVICFLVIGDTRARSTVSCTPSGSKRWGSNPLCSVHLLPEMQERCREDTFLNCFRSFLQIHGESSCGRQYVEGVIGGIGIQLLFSFISRQADLRQIASWRVSCP